MKSMLGGLITLVVLVVGLRVVYSRVMSAATEDTSHCLFLESSTTTVERGFTFITGIVRNDCDRGFSNITVTFKLYGDDTFGHQWRWATREAWCRMERCRSRRRE